MRSELRIKVDMAVRVRDFLRANPFESANGIAVTAQFEERVARALDLVAGVDRGETLRTAAVQHKHAVRTRLRREVLRHVERIGAAAAKELPELRSQVRMPRQPSDREFRAAAGNIAAVVAEHRALLDRYGLIEKIPAELEQGLAEFDQVVTGIAAARMTHTGARLELAGLGSELIAMV
ncbi:MAG: hypothetical protein ACYC2K_18995, partial [Gemmatimonadales bacterium]